MVMEAGDLQSAPTYTHVHVLYALLAAGYCKYLMNSQMGARILLAPIDISLKLFTPFSGLSTDLPYLGRKERFVACIPISQTGARTHKHPECAVYLSASLKIPRHRESSKFSWGSHI
jgi:hypothetical protein